MDQSILSVLRRGPKRGLTASAIATRGELNLNSVRSTLWALQSIGEVSVVGTEAPSFGRPANRYALTA